MSEQTNEHLERERWFDACVALPEAQDHARFMEQQCDKYRQALEALANSVRDYATSHDWKQYPQALVDAEELLYGPL